MAKSVVGFEAQVDTSQAVNSVKSLKAQLREAQQEVMAMADKFGETSEQAVKAAQKAAQLKDRIGDAKALTDAFSPDRKFAALGTAMQGVAGGFAAVQGAMGLLGSESEDLEKMLLKVNSTMALVQGLNAITEAKDGFANLKTVAVNAFQSIKSAIGSTGIGLLVIAVGTIYAYWDDIKGAVTGVTEETKKLKVESEKKLATSQKELKAVDDINNVLKLQGKSEREILQIKQEKIKVAIRDARNNVQILADQAKLQIAAEQRGYNVLKNILRFTTEFGLMGIRIIAAPIDLLLKTANTVAESLGFQKITATTINEEISKLAETATTTVAKFVFDPEKTKQEGLKTIDEANSTLTKLLNEQAGYQLQLQQLDKDAAKKSAKDAKENETEAEALRKQKEADEKARLENLIAQNKHADELIQQNRLSAIKDEFTKRQMELATQEQKEIDDELERLNNKLITQEQYEINKNNITQKYANLQTQLVTDEEQKRLEIANKKRDEDLKNEEAKAQAKIDLAQSVGNALGELSNLIGAQTAVGKGLALAQIAIDTGLAISALTKNSEANPLNAVTSGISGAIQFATGLARIIANIAKAKQILSQANVPSRGGGGGNIPTSTNAPLSPQLQVQNTQLNQSQINQLASATSRAFVLESDVSGSQERIRRINRAARIN